MADVLALVDDLFFQAKMMETARHVGVPLRVVSSGAALVRSRRRTSPGAGAGGPERPARGTQRAHAVVRGRPGASRGVSLPCADRFGRAGARGRLPGGAPALEIYRRSRRDSAPGEIMMASMRKMRAGRARAAIAVATALLAAIVMAAPRLHAQAARLPAPCAACARSGHRAR